MIVVFSLASSALLADDQLFVIESGQIREIAFQAATEQYPDIPAANLLDPDHFVIWCMSALTLQLVDDVAKDFDYCHASVSFTLGDSTVKRKYLAEDGNCYSETEQEVIKVKVYSNRSTEVGQIGVGAGRVQHDCSEEFEGWSE